MDITDKRINSVIRIIKGKTAGDISTVGMIMAGIRCYEAGYRAGKKAKKKTKSS